MINYCKIQKESFNQNIERKFFLGCFFLLKFFATVFVYFIISSHVITESSLILAKYLPFSQVHVVGFQI